MTTLVVATSEGVRLRQELAGAGSRLAAGALDGLILVFSFAIVFIAALIPVSFDPSGMTAFVVGLLLGGAVLYFILYHVLFHALWAGQTPGKRSLGLRVMSADGHPPSNLQVVLRALISPVDVALMIPAPIGLLCIAATERHQRLGDLVGGTVVVRTAQRSAAPEPWPGQRWSDLQLRALPLAPGLAARLSSEDRDFLRDLIVRDDLIEEDRRRLFVDAARHYSKRLDLGPFADARDVVREVYLFARESSMPRALTPPRASSAAAP